MRPRLRTQERLAHYLWSRTARWLRRALTAGAAAALLVMGVGLRALGAGNGAAGVKPNPDARAGQAASATSSKSQPGSLAPFDGARAFEDLKHLVSFGPRPAGSEALARARRWIVGELTRSSLKVEEDKFTAATPVGNLDMANLIVKIPGSSPEIVILAGHYDTKRFDQFKFVGANDGASSAALVMEAGRDLAKRSLSYTLWLVLFDGEEAQQQEWSASDSTYGSKHLVASLSAEGELSRVKALILVDMIGDAHLDIHRDPNSTRWLTDLEFATAHRLGYGRYFVNQEVTVGGDDYDPWLAAGVPSVDLIDFNYGPNSRSKPGDPDWNIYWHTAQDTVAHCSPQSLEIVGRVVMAMLQELEHSPHVRP